MPGHKDTHSFRRPDFLNLLVPEPCRLAKDICCNLAREKLRFPDISPSGGYGNGSVHSLHWHRLFRRGDARLQSHGTTGLRRRGLGLHQFWDSP